MVIACNIFYLIRFPVSNKFSCELFRESSCSIRALGTQLANGKYGVDRHCKGQPSSGLLSPRRNAETILYHYIAISLFDWLRGYVIIKFCRFLAQQILFWETRMYEKLGIVTNIWARRMGSGDSFEDLASQFGENGFREMEVRDHNYLRNSAFGDMMREIEAAMGAYTDEGWKAICEALWHDTSWSELIKVEHKSLFDKVSEFQRKMSDLTLSYAASHVWLAEPDDLDADNKRIIEAKKFAYLLCPHAGPIPHRRR